MLKPREIKYLQKIPIKQKVVVKPYDPKIPKITEVIIKQIKEVLPRAKIKFIGASALGISGQGDIDIYILENPSNFKKYSLLLRKLFGNPVPNSSLNEWRVKRGNHQVSIYLDDPNRQSMKNQLKVFEILASNNRLLKEYEEIKIKAAKFSMREYQKRKYEFYNKILKNYSIVLNKKNKNDVKNKLVIFDIDGTLIKSLIKSHELAFSTAFNKIYKIKTNIKIINHSGLTDQQIIIEVLKKKGLSEKIIRAKLDDCMQTMVNFFYRYMSKDKIVVLEGVKKLLKELDNKNVLMGIITGNLEEIARIKLRKSGVDHYFKIGSFGSEDISKSNLVKLVIKKAKKKFNFIFNNNVFLFGDTPHDIEAGKKNKIKTIGVATGKYSKQQLKEVGASIVLDNLKDTDNIISIISQE